YVLYRRDGMLLARYPRIDPDIGKPFARTMNFDRLIGALDDGVLRATSVFDGKERIIVPRAMEHFPLIVTVSDTVESILTPWAEQTQMLVGTTALLELVFIATILLSLRQIRG